MNNAMKKKIFLKLGAPVLIIAVVALLAVTLSAKWSQKSFNAVVQEVVTQQGGEKAEIMKNCPKDVLQKRRQLTIYLYQSKIVYDIYCLIYIINYFIE